MAKRGERRPWKVRYEWDSGIKGTMAYRDEWTAEHHASEIRTRGEATGRSVTVTVEYVAPRS